MRGVLAGLALLLFLMALATHTAHANDVLEEVSTRPGVKVPVYWMPRPGAKGTLVLLPGGAGSIGVLAAGKPSGSNFLVRSRDLFAAAGYNVALVSRPTDKKDLTHAERIGAEHMQDLQAVLAFLRRVSRAPIWLVGNSRGTISATAAALAFGDQLAGMVLTSSITDGKPGAVGRQNLGGIHIPTLVVHHAKDACDVCPPEEAKVIFNKLRNAPVRKLIMLDGGGPPTGPECESMHWHGYAGMEREAVNAILNWIAHPVP